MFCFVFFLNIVERYCGVILNLFVIVESDIFEFEYCWWIYFKIFEIKLLFIFCLFIIIFLVKIL